MRTPGPGTFFEKISFAPLTNAENISIITPMIKKTKNTAAYRRVASRLKRLLGEGQVIEGSLSRVTAGSAAHWHLTRKVNGRTQTLYRGRSSRPLRRERRRLGAAHFQVHRQAPGRAAGLGGSAEGVRGLRRAVPPGPEPASRRPRREAEGRRLRLHGAYPVLDGDPRVLPAPEEPQPDGHDAEHPRLLEERVRAFWPALLRRRPRPPHRLLADVPQLATSLRRSRQRPWSGSSCSSSGT